MTSTERANWTIAYRKRTANRFLRVSTWAGTWSQAVGMARLFSEANPDLEVYYTSNRTAEIEGFVIEEDRGNILVDSGRRVRIVETDIELPAEMIARIPNAKTARERWTDGDPIPNAEGAEPAAAFVPLVEVAAKQNFKVVERDGAVRSIELWRDGRLVQAFRKTSAARVWLAASNTAEQMCAWWERHGLDKLPTISAEDVLAARAADWDEAIAAEQTRRAATALLVA
jgi:hypothetical protein